MVQIILFFFLLQICYRFPAAAFAKLLDKEEEDLIKFGGHVAFKSLVAPLREAVTPYVNPGGLPGSERTLVGFIYAMRNWIDTERWFCDGVVYADAVENLRQANKENLAAVLDICRAHSQVRSTANLMMKMIDSIHKGIEMPDSLSRSIVGGAHSIHTVVPCLSEIGSMGGNDIYRSVSLQARRLLLQESLPSISKRKLQVIDIVKSIAASKISSLSAQYMIKDEVLLSDIILPILSEVQGDRERSAVLEFYARKLYRNEVVKNVIYHNDESLLKIEFTPKQEANFLKPSAPMSSMLDLTRMVSSGSLSQMSDMSDPEVDESVDSAPSVRSAVFAVVNSLEEIELGGSDVFEKFLQAFPHKSSDEPVNNLYVCVLRNDEYSNMDELGARLEHTISHYRDIFISANLRRVSFVIPSEVPTEGNVLAHCMPAQFTFRSQYEFKEDTLFRHIDPAHAYHLELSRLAKNFNVKGLNSHQTQAGSIQLYKATPRSSALSKDINANQMPRLFVRALSFIDTLTISDFENIFVEAMNTLDLKGTGNSDDNHLFINVISDGRVVLDPTDLEQSVMTVIKRHSNRVQRLGLAEVETRLECCLSEGSPPIAIRLVANNPTGFVHVLNTYVEALDESETRKVFRLVGGTKANIACSGDSSWEGLDVNFPYPLTRPFEKQRRAAAMSSDTLYCYDLPALFEAAVELKWTEAAISASIGSGVNKPLMGTYTTELVVQKKSGESGPWTMQDYFNGDLELVEMHRGAGANDVGMVAWLMTLKTTEYPNVSSELYHFV